MCVGGEGIPIYMTVHVEEIYYLYMYGIGEAITLKLINLVEDYSENVPASW